MKKRQHPDDDFIITIDPEASPEEVSRFLGDLAAAIRSCSRAIVDAEDTTGHEDKTIEF